MTAPARVLPVGLAILLAGVPAARAEPPSADALQTQLRAALGQTLGADKAAPDKDASGLTVTREADGYRILLPIHGMQPARPDQPAGLQAVVHPLDSMRWAIDSLSVPTDSTVTVQAPPGGLKDAGIGTVHVHLDSQTGTGVFDPSYATPSTLDAGAAGVHTESSNAEIRQQARYDSYQVHLALSPHAVAAGTPPRLDLDQRTQLSGLHISAEGKTPFSLDAGTAQLNATVIDLSPDRAGALYGAMIRFMGAVLAGPAGAAPAATQAGTPPMPVDRTTLRALLDALPGLAAKMDVVESADRVRLRAADGRTYTFDHAGLGFGGVATDGVMATYADISLDNLQAPDQPDAVRALLPRRVHLHPTIGGIGTAELMAAANAATSAAGGDSGPLIAAMLGLFAHGGIALGITDLALEVGESRITGTGTLLMPAPLPAVFHGEGRIVATHFDALIAKLQADPQAAQAAGAMLAARQFAKPQGDALVWNIAYHDGSVFVNDKPLKGP